MKLLIITQKVDANDPILGFFHGWLFEFARRCEAVTVIAQQVGYYNLPDNVTVRSLGKERGVSSWRQVLTFWWLCLSKAGTYNRVFVHMTPIWVLLGAPLWLPLFKRTYLWYEIKRGSWKLSIASLLVKKIFAASEHGMPTVSKKQVIVGHGIDCDLFVPDESLRESSHLVAVGRVTAIKQYDVLLRTLSQLPECRLTVAGGTVTEADKKTEEDLRSLMHRLNIADRVHIAWLMPQDVVRLLQRADCMLHASQGGLDKAVLQAMACGLPVVSTSEAAQSVLPQECHTTSETMGKKVQAVLALSGDKRHTLSQALRATVERDHSLSQCIERIVTHMQ